VTERVTEVTERVTEHRALRLGPEAPFRRLVGVGGIGSGMFLALEGDATLGRNESRPAHLLDVRDYCKLHIVAHHVAVLHRGQVIAEGPPEAIRDHPEVREAYLGTLRYTRRGA